jgi:hypothetical protein
MVIINDRTVHNHRPDTVTLDKTVKQAHSVDVAIPSNHNLHSTVTEKLEKHTDLTEGLKSMWQLKTACLIPLLLSTADVIPDKLHERLKLLNLHPALYILMQKAVTLNTCRTVRKFLAEQ